MDITPEKLKSEMEKESPMVIVDLQEARLYQHNHIPGAINIPMDGFQAEYPALLKDKDLPTVVTGEFDELGKGSKAGEILEAAGYTKVGHIVGGLMAWRNAGYPTESGVES